jgi:hypothetical protein
MLVIFLLFKLNAKLFKFNMLGGQKVNSIQFCLTQLGYFWIQKVCGSD